MISGLYDLLGPKLIHLSRKRRGYYNNIIPKSQVHCSSIVLSSLRARSVLLTCNTTTCWVLIIQSHQILRDVSRCPFHQPSFRQPEPDESLLSASLRHLQLFFPQCFKPLSTLNYSAWCVAFFCLCWGKYALFRKSGRKSWAHGMVRLRHQTEQGVCVEWRRTARHHQSPCAEL